MAYIFSLVCVQQQFSRRKNNLSLLKTVLGHDLICYGNILFIIVILKTTRGVRI